MANINNAVDWWLAKQKLKEDEDKDKNENNTFLDTSYVDNDTNQDTTDDENGEEDNEKKEKDEDDDKDTEKKKDSQVESDALKFLYMNKLKKTFLILIESFDFLSDDFTGPLYRVTHNNKDREEEFESAKAQAFARVIKEEKYITETSKEVIEELTELVTLIKEKKHEDEGEY